MTRVLVAGVGNMFLSDDGFGPEVARRLGRGPLPVGVRVVDYGIRGMHLAFDLLDGWERLIVVDTVPEAGGPGGLVVLEVGPDDLGGGALDAHGMDPASMLASLGSLGGSLPPTVVVGCQPLSLVEGIGLSAPVEAAVEVAVARVLALLPVDAGGPAGDGEPARPARTAEGS